jgi:hypothetical protein
MSETKNSSLWFKMRRETNFPYVFYGKFKASFAQSPELHTYWRLPNSLHTDFQQTFNMIKRIVFLDFIHRLVSQEQTKLRKLKIIDRRTQYTRPRINHTRVNY